MLTHQVLDDYLKSYLSVDVFQDYAPNGLQIVGKNEITTLCTAVSASLCSIQKAVDVGADALLVHHGFFWRGEEPVLVGLKRSRIAALLRHDINLFAFHLPLDCHREIGNNACIGRLLDIQEPVSHRQGRNRDLLWSGRLAHPFSPEAFHACLEEKFHRKPLHISVSNAPIQRIAWCSGAAQDFIEDAALLGVDAYLSGEISERTYYQAKEYGIHYFACGHHATERFGIRSLGEHLAEAFGVEHHFIDAENPI
jgi:dinuclear metal center YbgI/SA1388 family protein